MREFSYDCLNLLSRVRKSSAESWKVRVGGVGCFHAEKRRYKTVLKRSESKLIRESKGVAESAKGSKRDHLRWALYVFRCSGAARG